MAVFRKDSHKLVEFEQIFFVKNEDGKEKNDEGELQKLLFENPELFPIDVNSSDVNTSYFIPLVRELSVDKHGIIDILATDSSGNIFIIECKLAYNYDNKKIRGQITDYVSGIWSKYTIEASVNENKFEEFWTWLCNEIMTKSNKKLDNIIEESMSKNLDIPKTPGNDLVVKDIVNNIKENFRHNRVFLIFAVDLITDTLREIVNWHNYSLDRANNYPAFILEVSRFKKEGVELISTRTYPSNLKEIKSIKSKRENASPRAVNDYDKWVTSLERNSPDGIEKIKEFVNKLNSMVEKNNGSMEWGTGKNPNALPVFENFPERKPIGIRADGVCIFQFRMMQNKPEYKSIATKFENEIRAIGDFKNELKTGKDTGLTPDKWINHSDEILKCLEIFL